MALPVENTEELSIGGFQGIKKIRGLLVSIEVTAPPDTWENRSKDVVKVVLEDAVVLEMFGGDDPMELKEGKFNFTIPYTENGKKPHQNSIYNKCWLESARELGFRPSEKIGQYVTFEKQPRVLFEQYKIDPETKKPILDEAGQKIKVEVRAVNKEGMPNHFCFAKEASATDDVVKEKIRSLVLGNNEKTVLRKLISDPTAKQYPDYKERLNNKTLAEFLGLKLVDGVFTKGA
jgi:hypothetical protein